MAMKNRVDQAPSIPEAKAKSGAFQRSLSVSFRSSARAPAQASAAETIGSLAAGSDLAPQTQREQLRAAAPNSPPERFPWPSAPPYRLPVGTLRRHSLVHT